MEFLVDTFKRDVRTKRGSQSLRDIGELLDIAPSTINRLETGTMPDLLTYVKICQWLGVSLNKYFDKSYSFKLAEILKEMTQAIDYAYEDKSMEGWGKAMIGKINKL